MIKSACGYAAVYHNQMKSGTFENDPVHTVTRSSVAVAKDMLLENV